MVESLKHHPRVQILNTYQGKPLTERYLVQWEKRLGFQLPQDVRDFYKQCNGLQLRWVDRKNPSNRLTCHQKSHKQKTIPFYHWEQPRSEEGSIMILPFQKVFHPAWGVNYEYEWKGPTQVLISGKVFNTKELNKHIRQFDIFSYQYEMVFMLMPKMMVTMGMEYQNHRRTTFSEYLEFLLQSYGYAKNRELYYAHKLGMDDLPSLEDLFSELGDYDFMPGPSSS
ncbi:MAG: SMI1/KNR4 family protein [Bacteroidia bacterium]